jgi:hypothetical protein
MGLGDIRLGVDVIYQEDYRTGRTDLIHVGTKPPSFA